MKKTLLMLAAGIAVLLGTSACGGGSDEPTEPATATYIVNLSPDALSAGTYIVYYKDANNTTKFEVISTSSWSKTVSSTRFPAMFGFKIKASPENETALTKDSYDLSVVGTIKMTRGAASVTNAPLNYSATVEKHNVERAIESNINNAVVAYNFSADGNATVNNKMSFD